MMGLIKGHLFVALLLLMVGGTAAADDLEAGKKQFLASCGTCHVVDPAAGKRQGPPLNGILGRKAGSVPGYAYSPALSASTIVWDEPMLDRWIENAQALVPGARMPYHQADAEKRHKVIAYLKSLSGPD